MLMAFVAMLNVQEIVIVVKAQYVFINNPGDTDSLSKCKEDKTDSDCPNTPFSSGNSDPCIRGI